MRNEKGQFIKGHLEGVRFVKGQIPWNKGMKGFGFGQHPENMFKPRKFSEDEKKHITIICKFCKKEFRDYASNKRNFCSQVCKDQFMSTLTGEKSPNWQGGIVRGNRHRARKYGKEGYYTFAEWENLKSFYNYMCLCCKKTEPEIKLTEDHIIPISRGGDNNIENIQPLCMGCNKKKFTKSINYKMDFEGRYIS